MQRAGLCRASAASEGNSEVVEEHRLFGKAVGWGGPIEGRSTQLDAEPPTPAADDPYELSLHRRQRC
jgi:hypothetical protein